ncbi:hypothetical protein BC939DRAFT_504907 [Gamsiella multidivaricata]|uniref:uncharacterized protein n=1 Tax=Gamsiella multidivaricata TaxID=101098 RepID=UPI00221E8D33|nr:uncharacterized protein BC939DRAFT_504907 [Gamsiella multidivaricata]KAG0369622.1 hypothetical protein BGZ54_009431 [Gamsiella multidivaricata]KAI7820697.1 hypothetical protein BC939DRAFT_504907 [Gamsiella multidivaricata]
MNRQVHCESLSPPPPSSDAGRDLDQPSIVSASTSRKDTSKSTASKDRFTKEDFDRVLSWLEHKPNFDLLHRTSGRTSVGKPSGTASSGYATLAALVSRHSKGRLNLTARAMRERFQRHKNKYKSVKDLSSRTGFEVTDEDRKNGIYTMTGKLESLCACYQRMDNLFGQKPNVPPLVELTRRRNNRSRGLPDAVVEDQGVIALDNSFIDNDNDNSNDDGNNSNDDVNSDLENNEPSSEDNEEPSINPTDVYNLDDTLDDIQVSAFTDNADQGLLSEPGIDGASAAADPPPALQVGKSRPSKRQALDTESNVSSKKSRVTDTRKAPPKVDHGPSRNTRNGFTTAYLDSSTSKLEEIEEKKLEQEKVSDARRMKLDQKRVALEERRIALEKEQAEKQREAEKELLGIRLKWERESEEKRIELEEKKLLWEKEKLKAESDFKFMMQKAMLVQSAMSNGFKLEDIKAIMAIIKDK